MKQIGLAVTLLATVLAGRVDAGLLEQLFYDGITGVSIDELKNAPGFPDAPDDALPLDLGLTTPRNQGDDYGSLIRGFLQSPVTGDVTFYAASDDASEFWLSTDHDPANIELLAFETGCCTALFGGDRLEERSGTVSLERGSIYYFEALYKEGGGGDWMDVGWELPDGTQEIIPRGWLFPFSRTGGGAPVIDLDAFDVTVTEKVDARIFADLSGSQPMTFQWFRDGQAISGADLAMLTIESPTLADDFSTFTVHATNAQGTVESGFPANLFVVPDITPPELVGTQAGIIDPNILTLEFSERVSASSANNTSNYQINNDATVVSAALQDDGVTVVLTAEGIEDSKAGYSVTVTGVQDGAESPNSISSVTSDLVLFPGGLVETSDGFVVFEAENFDEIRGESWVVIDDDGTRGTPSGGKSVVHPNGEPGGEGASQLLYNVTFNQAGRHIVWYRASGDNGSDDSAWLHIDGARPPERLNDNDAAMTGFSGNDFEWNSDSFNGPDPMDFNLETSGLHTIGLARREDGSYFDKFIITTDPDYNPDVDDDGINRPETRVEGEPLPDPSIEISQQPTDQTAIAGLEPVTFTVEATTLTAGQPTDQVIVNWIENGVVIPDAGGTSYTIENPGAEHDGRQYQAIVRMPGLRVLSEPATLTVITDVEAPRVVGADGSGTFRIATVGFSEALDAASATDASNYSIVSVATGDSLAVINATLKNSTQVELETGQQVPREQYRITVNNVADQSPAANKAVNQTVTFTAFVERVGEVLLIVDSNGPNDSDLAVAADLDRRGLLVDVKGATASELADAANKLLIVIASSVNSGDVADRFQSVDVPVIYWEQALQDEFLMTQDDGAFRGSTDLQTAVNIVDPDHPLAAGLSAGIHEVSAVSGFSWGVPESDAIIVATLADNPDRAAIYVVEKGWALIDGTTPAPDKRIYIFFTDSTFTSLNADGLALWEAAVRYAVPGLPELPEAPPVGGADPAELTVSLTGGDLTVSWNPPGGTLQSAPAVTGPWTPVQGASSPHTVSTDGATAFFRVVGN